MSGVMMPGPVFAVTVAKSERSPYAGALVALGHGIVEVPLIMLIYFGIISVLHVEAVQAVVGVLGGFVLFSMGVMAAGSIRQQAAVTGNRERLSINPVAGGIVTTLLNPYFLIWWAFVGAALITQATAFGRIGLALFVAVHLLCDVAWLTFVGFAVHRSGRLWGSKVTTVLIAVSAALLVGFGLYFLISTLLAMA